MSQTDQDEASLIDDAEGTGECSATTRRSYTCPTCREVWPTDYCPFCKATIHESGANLMPESRGQGHADERTVAVSAEAAVGEQDVGRPAERRMMPFSKVLFSFEGRISRSEYWLKGFIGCWLLFGVPSDFLYFFVREESLRLLGLTIGIVGVWPGLAVLVKRWHDRDRSAWLLLLLFLPILNWIVLVWVLVELWFLKGTDGMNRFGEDPLQRRGPV